jgi:hypothetical protein
MHRNIILASTFLMLSLPVPLVGKEWRGIVPLHSNCEDVKRILGVKKCEYPASTYELQDETVEISFKKYSCHEKWPFETWKVPVGTVESIRLKPKRPLQLSDYLASGTYTKKEEDVVGLAWYSNSDGVSVEAFNEKVLTVIYHPSLTDEHLRCSTFDKSWRARGAVRPPSLFKSYDDIPLDKEKEILDEYMRQLQEYGSDSRGYVLVYAGRRTHLGEAQERAQRIKAYLVRVRGIERDRIGILDGGYREELTVELHIGLRGMLPPFINPTVHPSDVILTNAPKSASRKRFRHTHKKLKLGATIKLYKT